MPNRESADACSSSHNIWNISTIQNVSGQLNLGWRGIICGVVRIQSICNPAYQNIGQLKSKRST
jgi:hypothetical protein